MRSTMRTIRPAWLVAVSVVTAVIGWVATELTSRGRLALPVLPFSSLITMGLIVVVCLVLGFKVRRWRDGKRDKVLDPLLAARTVVLEKHADFLRDFRGDTVHPSTLRIVDELRPEWPGGRRPGKSFEQVKGIIVG